MRLKALCEQDPLQPNDVINFFQVQTFCQGPQHTTDYIFSLSDTVVCEAENANGYFLLSNAG